MCVHTSYCTLFGLLQAVRQVGDAVSALLVANCHELVPGSTNSLNAGTFVPSSDRIVPPVACGLTQAETVNAPCVLTGVPVVTNAVPVVPSKLTSGLNWSSVRFHA